MNLYEFEGKQILSNAGIHIPKSQLITSNKEKLGIKLPVMLKSQVLSGKRKKAGGIICATTEKEYQEGLKKLFNLKIKGEKVQSILIEEVIKHEKEYYCSISYDTDSRGALLTISSMGGIEIESNQHSTYPISTINSTIPDTIIPKQIIQNLVKAFFDNDCLLIEINPLVQIGENWIALDAKIKLDDDAKNRHPEWNFPPRSAPGHTPTQQEITAKQIDLEDYRGTAGSTYFDLDGDIAVLGSGGGISLVAMDALIKAGGKPANYTEYSGNPPKEKVIKLTKIVLSKPKINGLWIIGTVTANFTDIYETLIGIVEGLESFEKETGKRIDYPIVIRRGGPRDEEIFEKLKKMEKYNFHLQGPETSIEQSANIITNLAKQYASIT